jgi:hypothetical protein
MPQLHLWNEMRGEVHAISHENWTIRQESLQVLHDDQLHPYHYSRSAHLFLVDRPVFMQFLEWLRHERTADMTFCEQTKRVLSVAVCSTSTSHFWTPDNSHAICDYGYQISVWTVTARDIVVGPYMLPDRPMMTSLMMIMIIMMTITSK